MIERLIVFIVTRDEERRGFVVGLDKLVVSIEQKRIVILQRHVHPVAAKQGSASANAANGCTILAVEVELTKCLPNAFETASQHYLNTMNAFCFLVILNLAFSTVGQKVMTIENKVREANDADDYADLT